MEDLPSLISSAIEATLNNTEAMRVYAAEKADKLGRDYRSWQGSRAGMEISDFPGFRPT